MKRCSASLVIRKIQTKTMMSQAHACNPNYLGGRNQENQGSKPDQANSSWDPVLRIPITKKGWWVAQVVAHQPSKYGALSSSSSTAKKKPQKPNVMPPHTMRIVQIISWRKIHVEEWGCITRGLSYMADGNAKWYSHFGEQIGNFL
jgi:hypothetical protein